MDVNFTQQTRESATVPISVHSVRPYSIIDFNISFSVWTPHTNQITIQFWDSDPDEVLLYPEL